MRRTSDPEVIMRVRYVVDPDNARAAQEILREGFRRALAKAVCEKRQHEQRNAG